MNKYNLKRIISIVLNDEKYLSMTYDEILKKLRDTSNLLLEKWRDTKNLELYQDPRYIQDLIQGYRLVSQHSSKNTVRFFEQNVSNYRDLTYFDDYNGIGLTTLDFIKYKLDINFFNDNLNQIEAMNKYMKQLNIPIPYLDKKRERKYDVVCSFEIAEHMKKPVEYIEMIMEMSKKWLSLSTGFSYTVWFGHYDSYLFNGKEVSIRKASVEVRKKIMEEFVLVKKFWNGRPSIYKRKEVK